MTYTCMTYIHYIYKIYTLYVYVLDYKSERYNIYYPIHFYNTNLLWRNYT